MIAALRTTDGITQEEKAEARSRIMTALAEKGGSVEAGSWASLRETLRLDEQMSMGLFKSSMWHLNSGDREPDHKPRIMVMRPGAYDRWHSADGCITVRIRRD